MKLSLPTALVLVQFFIFFLMLLVFIIFPASLDTPLRIPGLVMMVGGLGLVLIAVLEHTRINQNGPSVSPAPNENADLVTSGLYSKVRHPIYTGVLMAGLGAGLFHGHPAAVVLGLFLIPFFTYKSMVEERLLVETYPEYEDYMRVTGRFLPPLG